MVVEILFLCTSNRWISGGVQHQHTGNTYKYIKEAKKRYMKNRESKSINYGVFRERLVELS